VIRFAAQGMALSFALLPLCALAHHSVVGVFDQTKPIELRGVVVDFKLRSPHTSLVVDGRVFVGDQARGVGVERWEIEWDSLPVLKTMGVDARTFQAGDTITVTGAPHRDPDFKFAHARVVVAANGRAFGLASGRVFSPSLRQAIEAATGAALPAAAAAASTATGIERLNGRWQQPLTIPGTESALSLNEAGAAARSAYDRKLSPANTCEPMSVPDVFTAPFYLVDVKLADGRLVVHNEAYDIVRSFALDGRAAPADPRGLFGTASARVDGETVVVESRGFPPSKWGLGAEVQALGGGADVPSSEQKVVTERYSVTADGTTFVYEYTLYDPVYMREPYQGRLELTRIPAGVPMYPFDCDVESASMWSRTNGDKPLRVDP
jgi:hypothetical protein